MHVQADWQPLYGPFFRPASCDDGEHLLLMSGQYGHLARSPPFPSPDMYHNVSIRERLDILDAQRQGFGPAETTCLQEGDLALPVAQLDFLVLRDRTPRAANLLTRTGRQSECCCQASITEKQAQGGALGLQSVGTATGSQVLGEIGSDQFISSRVNLFQVGQVVCASGPVYEGQDVLLVDASRGERMDLPRRVRPDVFAGSSPGFFGFVAALFELRQAVQAL